MISSEGPFKVLVTFKSTPGWQGLSAVELDDVIRWERANGWWFFEKWDEDAYFSMDLVQAVAISTKAKEKP